MPFMEGGVGSGHVAPQEGSLRGPQSLDSVNNPSGAQGSAVDLSMAGSSRKKSDGSMMSSLYQAPAEDVKPAAPAAAAASPANLADALRDVSRKSASVDPTGWAGQKPQKGFEPPKAGFGAMSGFSGSSGSGASASSSHGGAVSGFGSQKADTGMSVTKGLRGGDEPATSKGKAMGALEGARNQAVSAAAQTSNDSARAMSGATFDGGSRGGNVRGNDAASSGGGAGVYGSLDAAPMNLKMNNPNLSQQKVDPPMPKKEPVEDPNDKMRQMVMQMMMMMAMAGIMGGLGGM